MTLVKWRHGIWRKRSQLLSSRLQRFISKLTIFVCSVSNKIITTNPLRFVSTSMNMIIFRIQKTVCWDYAYDPDGANKCTASWCKPTPGAGALGNLCGQYRMALQCRCCSVIDVGTVDTDRDKHEERSTYSWQLKTPSLVRLW